MADNDDFDFPTKWFEMTPIKPGDRPSITKEELYAKLVKQMTNMDEKEIHNIADLIVSLIFEIRKLKPPYNKHGNDEK